MSETNISIKTADELAAGPSDPVGRMVVEYLNERQEGASLANIIRHIRKAGGLDQAELTATVMTLLKNGTSLGFLEREGSHYKNWTAREARCGRRRRKKRCCCCPKKRRRRRSCKRRRRRRC